MGYLFQHTTIVNIPSNMSSRLSKIKAIYIVIAVLFFAVAVRCNKPVPSKSKPVQKSSYPIFSDSLNLQYGIASRRGTLLNKGYFIINHNDTWKIPYWVAYYLTAQHLEGETKRQGQFRPDPRLPVGARAELKDYEKSGYNRGHMAPAADFKRSKDAMTATFLLSNMSPQTPQLNQKIWQRLEDEVRDKVKTEGGAWIITGNVFMSADSHFTTPTTFIGFNKVAVPTHCFKCVLSTNKKSAFSVHAFLLPNRKTFIPGKPIDYSITIDRLEQITCYDFFPLLDDTLEDRLESKKATDW